MYALDRSQQTLLLNGKLFSQEEIRSRSQRRILCVEDFQEGDVLQLREDSQAGEILPSGEVCQAVENFKTEAYVSFEEELFDFLRDWFSPSSFLDVQTSGSTGQPKMMAVEKSRMIESARLTCSFLGLKKDDTAFLCMPLKFIGGKMLVVRALVASLNLIIRPPSGNPLKDMSVSPQFAAMLPLQVAQSLKSPLEKKCLMGIENLIIGGSAIDAELEAELQNFPHALWSTYGMTETLSHIALRRLNGIHRSDSYQAFDGVELSLSEPPSTLCIRVKNICDERIMTNDIAEINDNGTFRVLGRKDNVINSGGIKIQIEELENELKKYIHEPFLITSVPDSLLGEKVVFLSQVEIPLLSDIFKEKIQKYHRPKICLLLDKLPMTETGKPARAEAKKIVRSLLK